MRWISRRVFRLDSEPKFRQKRNGKGIIYYKRPEDVKVISVCSVDKDDELLVIGKEQVTRVKADEITIAKDRLVGKGSMVQKTNGNSIISVIMSPRKLSLNPSYFYIL